MLKVAEDSAVVVSLYGYAGNRGDYLCHRCNRCCSHEFLPYETERTAGRLATLQIEIYKDLAESFSGIVGTDSTPDGNKRFASAYNTIHLIASPGVIAALHAFQDEVSISNTNKNDDNHDALLSRLEWELRKDLRIRENPPMNEFKARLWCSGSVPNKTDSRG